MKQRLIQIVAIAATLLHLTSAIECDTVIIDKASDAEAVRKDCYTITHDVTVTSKANGDIVLDGVENVGGSLRVESGSGVTNLSSSTLKRISGSLTIQNAAHLQAVYLPELRQVGKREPDETFSGGTITLEDLPELTQVRFESIRLVGGFRAIKLPKWKEITPAWNSFWIASSETDGLRGFLEIQDVGLKDLKKLRAINSETRTDGGTQLNEITIRDNPNLRDLKVYYNYTKTLTIVGNGDLSLSLLPEYIDVANITGVRSLAPGTVAKLTARNNTFETLGSPFTFISDLIIDDNANFKGFDHGGGSWIEWTAHNELAGAINYLTSIQLTRVPALNLAPNLPSLGEDVTYVDGSTWPETYCDRGTTAGVCMRNMSTVIIEGNVSNGFFAEFLLVFWNKKGRSFWAEDEENKRDIRTHGRVLDQFEINSTNKGFNCTQMHELRDVGLFAGEYSCNGESVPITRDAWASTAANLRVSAVLLATVCSVYVWMLV